MPAHLNIRSVEGIRYSSVLLQLLLIFENEPTRSCNLLWMKDFLHVAEWRVILIYLPRTDGVGGLKTFCGISRKSAIKSFKFIVQGSSPINNNQISIYQSRYHKWLNTISPRYHIKLNYLITLLVILTTFNANSRQDL